MCCVSCWHRVSVGEKWQRRLRYCWSLWKLNLILLPGRTFNAYVQECFSAVCCTDGSSPFAQRNRFKEGVKVGAIECSSVRAFHEKAEKRGLRPNLNEVLELENETPGWYLEEITLIKARHPWRPLAVTVAPQCVRVAVVLRLLTNLLPVPWMMSIISNPWRLSRKFTLLAPYLVISITLWVHWNVTIAVSSRRPHFHRGPGQHPVLFVCCPVLAIMTVSYSVMRFRLCRFGMILGLSQPLNLRVQMAKKSHKDLLSPFRLSLFYFSFANSTFFFHLPCYFFKYSDNQAHWTVKGYRHITFCNVNHKIFCKFLTNYLKCAISNVITTAKQKASGVDTFKLIYMWLAAYYRPACRVLIGQAALAQVDPAKAVLTMTSYLCVSSMLMWDALTSTGFGFATATVLRDWSSIATLLRRFLFNRL